MFGMSIPILGRWPPAVGGVFGVSLVFHALMIGVHVTPTTAEISTTGQPTENDLMHFQVTCGQGARAGMPCARITRDFPPRVPWKWRNGHTALATSIVSAPSAIK
jgi:hypothetical protein